MGGEMNQKDFHQMLSISTEVYAFLTLTERNSQEHSYLHSGLLSELEHLHSWRLSKVNPKVPTRSTKC